MLKVKKYLRYGDDFIFVEENRKILERNRETAIDFLKKELKLSINYKADRIFKAKQGIHFLGVKIYPKGRKLSKRNWTRTINRLNSRNCSSYWGLVQKHENIKKCHILDWKIKDLI